MTVETLQRPEIFAADEHLMSIFQKAFSESGLKSGKHGWRTIKSWSTLSSKGVAPLFVVWTMAHIDCDKIKRLHKLKREKVFLLFQGDLPARSVADRMAWLDVRNDRRIHFVETGREDEQLFAERFLLALDSENYENRILDAWWEKNILVVVSPTKDGFNKLRVPMEKLPILQSHEKKELENFEIDEDGIFIYWPDVDIHLGWEQFEQAIDQQAYLKAKHQSDAFNKAYGAAIREFRQKSGLRQSDIRGLTPRHVGRVERGECRATYSALSKLAKAQNMSISEYMDELAKLL